ncbi:hypothetical protein ElyMa_003131500 [Elysia marginata]|uniref:Glycosyltransferase family 92 protein n=1 Tax=Elysia marginata TaxID=1093978 RepID=A0AAV4IW06_9GAST|nr:hypothetical protein ElyMa_003131500 [Elysia marginata]
MWREQKRIKIVLSVFIPSLLFALLAFQAHRCINIINLRNPYVLEQLTFHSDWIWNSLSEKVPSLKESNNGKPENGQDNENTSGAKDSHKSILLEQLPPFIVHYLWCIDGHFELNHYLSVLSAIYFLHPDELIIHYRTKPRADSQGYWRWLEDLQRDVIFLSLKPLKDDSSCHYDIDKVGSDFSDQAGVFLLGDVLITNISRSYLVNHYAKLNEENHKHRRLEEEEKEERKDQLFIVSSLEPYQIAKSHEHSVLRCPSFSDVYNEKHPMNASCVSLNKYLHSEEILQRDTVFNRFVRKLLYGSENAVQGKKHSSVQIPSAVHLILQDDVTELTPLHYVSIKSAFLKGQADSLYIHSLHQPSGELWDRLKDGDNLNIKYIRSEASAHKDVKHPFMMYALYTLLQHGGILHFGDVVFVSPIPEVTRSAGAIVSPHYSKYRLRHRSINTDIMAGAVGSHFIQAMLAMVRQQKSTFPGSRVNDIASHVVEQIPESVALDGRLTSHQVCYETHCEVEGGHTPPQQAYTTRLRWTGKGPESLEELKHIQGPFRNDLVAIIDA